MSERDLMRHDDFDAKLETVLEKVKEQTEDQAREYFCRKFNFAVAMNDADALVFWSAVLVVWKNAPLTDATNRKHE